MFARKGFVVPGRGENSGGDIEVFMRFGVTFVAVIFLVEAAPRPSPKAVPGSNSAGDGLQTVRTSTQSTWSEKARLGEQRTEAAVVFVNLHDVYDQATNAWKAAAPLPTPRSGVSAVLYRGRIVVDGGECNKGKPFIENEAYDNRVER